MAIKEKSGLARGLNSGHVSLHFPTAGKCLTWRNLDIRLTGDSTEQKVTPRESKPRISRTKGHLSKRTAFVREIVKEVSGYVVLSTTPLGEKHLPRMSVPRPLEGEGNLSKTERPRILSPAEQRGVG